MEKLYNGIILQDSWQEINEASKVPYLENPPNIIDIEIGRQLFVDDFLIEKTTLNRRYHKPLIHEKSPVFIPETELEANNGYCPVAAPFNDGIWYDEGTFKMWYHAGWFDGTSYAISSDGLHWERPLLDVVSGENRVIPKREGYQRDGALIWIDHNAEPSTRFKMFLFNRSEGQTEKTGELYGSFDGIHWGRPVKEHIICGDNTSFFYNPFRDKYVFSIRNIIKKERIRQYYEHSEFLKAAGWKEGEPLFWYKTDEFDKPDPLVGDTPQLYDLNAVGYESLLLGAFGIFYGPQNSVCEKTGEPKIVDLQIGYSRDGFHWYRPMRSGFISSSREKGTWNYGYIHAAGGVCLVVGDELWFYFTAFSGNSPRKGNPGSFRQQSSMYAGGSTGLAVLRRDGFASMESGPAGGELTTKMVSYKGKYLFVNANTADGELRVEIIDKYNRIIKPFTAAKCLPVKRDSCKSLVTWQGVHELSSIKEEEVKFRFHLTNGELYSFWVSDDLRGCSRGYMAAGGPGLKGQIDN